MTPGQLITKDPDAVTTKGFDWTAWLAALGAGATIAPAGSTYLVSPTTVPALEMSTAGIVVGELKTVVTLTGGIDGQKYTLTNRITATTGNVEDRSIYVLIQHR